MSYWLKCKNLTTEFWKNYTSRAENNIHRNIKWFWSFIRYIRNSDERPSTMYFRDKLLSNNKGVVDNCASFFGSVYKSNVNCNTNFDYGLDLPLVDLDITIGEIYNTIESLDVNSGPGTDAMENVLHSPHRGSNSSNIENYRPISLQNCMPKLFEGIVAHKLFVLHLLVSIWYFISIIHLTVLKKDYKLMPFIPTLGKLLIHFIVLYLGPHLCLLLFVLFINDISECLFYSYFLLFAHDLKLYHTIQDSLSHNKGSNKTSRTSNCSVIHFTHSRTISSYNNSINGSTLVSNLSFIKNVIDISNKALRNLDFIYTASRCFINVYTLRLLYCAIVRRHLEYCFVVWSPYLRYFNDIIEAVQHLLSFYMGSFMSVTDHDYAPFLPRLNLLALEQRRVMLNLLFAHKILNGAINCPSILMKFCICISLPSIRQNVFLYHECHQTQYGHFNCLNHVFINVNEFNVFLNFFGSHHTIRRVASWRKRQNKRRKHKTKFKNNENIIESSFVNRKCLGID
ncbi:uncharacterized protein LOC143187559 [Calliopsis andreniformis]|uniref:uncharacterized protein LOC143187559 n=1 Tax=Calliopsis andreniformis TaxID=337506 RepID=UPI003FCD87BE